MEFNNDAPLERIKGESAKAHTALMDYWTMGAGRSLQKLLDQYTAKGAQIKAPPTTYFNTLGTWSLRHHWQARIKRQKEIDDAIALERYRERHMSDAEVIARLSDMARADLSKFPDVEKVQDLDGHPMAHTIKKFKVTKRRQQDDTEIIKMEIELNDPQKALELLGKDLGRFKDRLDITTADKPFSIDDLTRARKELEDWASDDNTDQEAD